jgi:hypothetical protein
MTRQATKLHLRPRSLENEDGFSLIESILALGVLTFGLLAMAQAFTLGLGMLGGANSDLIAREKAAEAIESVYTARDTRVVTWAQIRNVVGASGSDGGVFRDGAQRLTTAGPDGLLNTADDGAVEAIMTPGPDNLLGTQDDVARPMIGFTREIEIRDVGANLRRIRVIIGYPVAAGRREFVLETFISSFA